MVVVNTILKNVLVVINTNLVFRNILAEFFHLQLPRLAGPGLNWLRLTEWGILCILLIT